jgi:MFS family permease
VTKQDVAHGLHQRVAYKWIALSNTTLGVLMASINATILIIALPAIFRGIHVNPLVPGQTGLLLWVLMGFNVATTVFLVTFGRISDTYGRVRLYNLGFAVFTAGSILLFLTPGTGLAGEWELIIFRFIQGIGGAFLFANSMAILTDAFPPEERGFALGLNQIAGIGGSVIGLVVGGLLASVDWRLVFLVSVPIGLAGTVWAYVALRELATTRESTKVDIWGNLTLGLGLIGVLVGLTYGIIPYGHDNMGWGNPFVRVALIAGVLLLVAFVLVERQVEDPLFHLELFRNRAFSAGNVAGFLAAIARGGLQFMIIIWLQGIWLPLHGVSYANTPLQAGIDTLPQMVGFLVAGPISGRLSDRYGARWFGFAGMIVSALGFFLLGTLPPDFPYWTFAIYLFLVGAGMGLFAAPNSSAIMSSLPPRFRGVGSGMRATFQNGGMMVSMGVFFTIVISVLASKLPPSLTHSLVAFGLPAPVAAGIAHLPPTATLFAALLGYNPMAHLLPPAVLAHLPPAKLHTLLGERFFPSLIATPFMQALQVVFGFSVAMSLISAVASLLRGGRFIYDEAAERAAIATRGQTEWLALATAAVYLARGGARPSASREERDRLIRALALLALLLGRTELARTLAWPAGGRTPTAPPPEAAAQRDGA